MKRIAVIGAGSWGIALALQAARSGAEVQLWARNPAARLPTGAMPRLPGFPLPSTVTVTDSLSMDADMVLSVVPMKHFAAVLARLETAAPVVLCCKGVEPDSLRFPLDILRDIRPDLTGAVLSGPNFAHEVAAGLPAAAVIAAEQPGLARTLADGLGTPRFRLYDSLDVAGVQLGAAAKNVIAIASGATIGAGLGENARAALVTRGLAEITRLAEALGGRAETMAGLAGIGDLMLTCTGGSSRNYRVGLALGQGATLEQTVADLGGVAEGVATAGALARLAGEKGVSVPIIDAVTEVVSGKTPLQDAMMRLLTRPAKTES
ncbi:NAD(P)H-dependent glycerol-3-phosphate dehydrogenase [Acetobacter conturbans]|uniref:Glycerol-3-phosphate dehydrogenase [NAD(P)+] n=1 Tax=Acetobacter conturbans TaxID=1737472 RepID=A0ABX0K4Q4_9PROT|nr:NAD(P)H-dependent glycerol-3-phosphate dehydrogenase [Acetobacter conturbans]NHN89638.1 NAD(P)H-dependent glycerol-3-phosphate dehydrogenase [Acetobacter conturbans]